MEEKVAVLFFDLFFTLVVPGYGDGRKEYNPLGITREVWERYAEDRELYQERASGKVKSPEKIINSILDKMGLSPGEAVKTEVLCLRAERMKNALINVDPHILKTLHTLKEKELKLCLISNSDVIDTMYWKKSPLSEIFEEALFSHETGHLKPEPEIYREALHKMKVRPEQGLFIGDGGSEELKGAKESGIKTILAGYFIRRDEIRLKEIRKWADYYVTDIRDILPIINCN